MDDFLQRYEHHAYLSVNEMSSSWHQATARQYAADYGRYLPSDPSAEILDLGCGAGSFLRFLRDRGFSRLHGVDYSQDQVRLAHEQGLPDVVHTTAQDFLRGVTAKFDLISLNDLIEHFPKSEIPLLLSALREALKPGGRVLLRTPNMSCPLASTSRYIDFTHEVGFTEWSLAALLSASGFTDIVVSGSELPGNSPMRVLRRLVASLWRAGWWFAHRVHGFQSPRVLTVNLVATARRPLA